MGNDLMAENLVIVNQETKRWRGMKWERGGGDWRHMEKREGDVYVKVREKRGEGLTTGRGFNYQFVPKKSWE